MQSSLAEIAGLLDAELVGSDAPVTGVAPLDQAGPTDLSLCLERRYAAVLRVTKAAGVLLARRAQVLVELAPCPVILVEQPRWALVRVLDRFYPEPQLPPGVAAGSLVDPQARVDPTARVEPGARVGALALVGAHTRVESGAVIGSGAVVGNHCRIGANAVVVDGCRLGNRVRLGPGAVVGSAGFGFVTDGERALRVPQVGTVEIEDDVEIGANSTLDRGTLGSTRIGSGTKIDNLVQVGHNVSIGKNVRLAAQVGLSGSVRIGDGAVLGGQAGVADHVVIGAGAQVGAKSGVGSHVPEGARVAGYPAIPVNHWLESAFLWRRIRKLLGRFRGPERRR